MFSLKYFYKNISDFMFIRFNYILMLLDEWDVITIVVVALLQYTPIPLARLSRKRYYSNRRQPSYSYYYQTTPNRQNKS